MFNICFALVTICLENSVSLENTPNFPESVLWAPCRQMEAYTSSKLTTTTDVYLGSFRKYGGNILEGLVLTIGGQSITERTFSFRS